MTDLAQPPEETVGLLVEQGWTAEAIIAAAEADIVQAEADIAFVDEKADEVAAAVNGYETRARATEAALAAFTAEELDRAESILRNHLHPGRDVRAVEAVAASNHAALNVVIHKRESLLAREAADRYRQHPEETIANARARIAAAEAL